MLRPLYFSLFGIFAAATPLLAQSVNVNLRGTVTDSAGAPLSGVEVKLEGQALTTLSGADGAFILSNSTSSVFRASLQAPARAIALREGSLFFAVDSKTEVTVIAYGLQGENLGSVRAELEAGSRSLKLPSTASGVSFLKVIAAGHETVMHALSMDGSLRGGVISQRPTGATAREVTTPSADAALAKASRTSAVLYDVVTASKTGYQKAYVSITNSDSSGMRIKLLPSAGAKFSFFVTSHKGLQALSKSNNGFGGDFRFGETGPGAGLRGADKICATLAEGSMPGSSVKGWRAFLSVTADASGKQVNAIDRIGEGPWYDRVGRLLAPKKADLLFVRPQNGDPLIQNDLPNEHGIPNHAPDPGAGNIDNHHMVTGSNASGALASATATCKDWTTAEGTSANGRPMCGFAWPRGGAGSTGSGSNWMTTFSAAGCGAGHHFDGSGGQASASGSIIGNNGGYGGFYCFALNP